MKVELSKREIEVILELMELGITFEITHGNPKFIEYKVSDNNEIPQQQGKAKIVINTNELKDKLKGYIKEVKNV